MIPEKYNLTNNESDEFKDIAYESFETVELNLAKAKEANKKLLLRFARRFDEIDEKTCEELLSRRISLRRTPLMSEYYAQSCLKR